MSIATGSHSNSLCEKLWNCNFANQPVMIKLSGVCAAYSTVHIRPCLGSYIYISEYMLGYGIASVSIKLFKSIKLLRNQHQMFTVCLNRMLVNTTGRVHPHYPKLNSPRKKSTRRVQKFSLQSTSSSLLFQFNPVLLFQV